MCELEPAGASWRLRLLLIFWLTLLGCLVTLGTARLASAQSAPSGSVPVRNTTPPTPLSDLDVAYPEGAAGAATVILTLTVERDGSVSAVEPNRPNEPFSGAAVSAALKWRFDPAVRQGAAVRVRIRVEVAFRPPAPVQ